MPGKPILTVIDPTAAEQPALARSADLAAAFGAPLELFICDYDQYLAPRRIFDSPALEKARQSVVECDLERLEKLKVPLVERGLSVTIDARWGHPLDRAIADKVREAQPRFVAKDTHFHAALKRTILSNTDWNLIRSCPAPLLLVKPRPSSPRPVVVAAVDPLHEHDKPADLDKAILAFAKELVTAVRGELHVLHVYDTAPAIAAAADSMTGALAAPVRDIAAAVERRHREALDGLLAEFPLEPRNVHLEDGSPHEVLIQGAERLRADFVVMGAVARGTLKRLLIGSTAERVLDRIACDLFVIKPTGLEDQAADDPPRSPERRPPV